MDSFDVVVIGLGIHGAATVHELARRGVRVLGIDMAEPPNARGSSNGRTRIIREAYFEGAIYVPLVQRAWDLWSELEELSGTVLCRTTGGVSVGPPDGELVRGALASAQEHGIEHELLTADQLRLRFPALLPHADHVAVYEPRAGVLLVEPCIRTLLRLAAGYGAVLRTGCAVENWRSDGDDVVITTTQGKVRARQLVIAAGAWLNPVLAMDTSPGNVPLQLPLDIERQVPHWFAPAAGSHGRFRAETCPLTLLEYDVGRYIYTLPDVGHGIKAGIHHEGEITSAQEIDREVRWSDEQRLRALVEQWLPGATDRVVAAEVCLYTNTRDGHFIVDRHPAHDNVLLLSPCSGHGFKFGPAIGEVAAELVVDGESWADLTAFSAGRPLRP